MDLQSNKSLPRLQAGSGSPGILIQGYNLLHSLLKCTQPMLIAFWLIAILEFTVDEPQIIKCMKVKWNSRVIKSKSMQQVTPVSILT